MSRRLELLLGISVQFIRNFFKYTLFGELSEKNYDFYLTIYHIFRVICELRLWEGGLL